MPESDSRSPKYQLLVVGVIVLGVSGAGTLRSQQRASSLLPAGEGRELVATACTQCHGIQPIVNLRDGREGWKRVVHEMILRGTQLTPSEAESVIEYLLRNFGPGRQPMQTGPLPPGTALATSRGLTDSQSISLPPGGGKDLVGARCVLCHDLGRVVTLRRSHEEWEDIVKNMVGRGLPATPEQIQSMVSYLTTQFGKP